MGSPAMNFIPATITGENGQASVSFPAAGGTANLPLFAGGNAPALGTKVIFGVRPEHLYRQSPAMMARPGMVPLSAPVVVVEPTGAETMAVLRFGDIEVVGRFSPDEAPKMGETMPLVIDMSRACLFDPTSQRLI
jgi:multiple sugar transport system ATP-binding protein